MSARVGRRRPRALALGLGAVLVMSLVAAACGGDDEVVPAASADDGGVDGGDADGGHDLDCPVLTLGTASLRLNQFGQITGVRLPITSGLAAADLPPTLGIELYDESTGGGLPPLTTGTFSLTAAPNDQLATCQHCVSIFASSPGEPAELAPSRVTFFQTRGSVTLDAVMDPLGDVFAGRIDDVTLREVRVDVAGRAELVPGGACARVPSLAFDTTPVDGGACTDVTDCPNEAQQICDPVTLTCAPLACFDGGGCADDEQCISQFGTAFVGACYERCDPRLPGACGGEGRTCVQRGIGPDQGICLAEGDGARGDTCTGRDAETGCEGDLGCSNESFTCTAPCGAFSGVPACAANERCSVLGRCEPPSLADPAAIGEACAASAAVATPCGASATRFDGLCFLFPGQDGPPRCEAICLGEEDCAADEFCGLRFDSGLGLCQADPVCGDGKLGEVGEVCDDGNTDDGDGCSGDCQVLDLELVCAAIPTLPLGIAQVADTTLGEDGFQSSCQFGLARSSVWRLALPGPGRLTLHAESPGEHILAVRTACAEAATELACAGTDVFTLTTTLELQVTSAAASELTVLLGALTFLEEDGASLLATFVPEACGDGIVAGREACDDANDEGGDGCAADCLTIEYSALCAAAPVLSISEPNFGDTRGAPLLYDATCAFSTTGGDRLYTFTAPRSGTLHLSLQQGDADLALTVFSGCGAPAEITELACSNVVDIEEAHVELAAGQRVTVVVDGFGIDDAGPYALLATFE